VGAAGKAGVGVVNSGVTVAAGAGVAIGVGVLAGVAIGVALGVADGLGEGEAFAFAPCRVRRRCDFVDFLLLEPPVAFFSVLPVA
jgi:hypothetical protein